MLDPIERVALGMLGNSWDALVLLESGTSQYVVLRGEPLSALLLCLIGLLYRFRKFMMSKED